MKQPAFNKNLRSVSLDAIDQFDDIIDVRTPAEYADDHLPGAINAPVLNNEERVIIGTLYQQESAFKATRLGAAMVARNIATHLDTLFADKPRDWQPLIYCWRGGKRSASMTDWFNLIGWRARQLEGGYKGWRRHVMDGLMTRPSDLRFIVLAGPTGSGKTRLLTALADAGAQTLDLEALACHRGSLLGDLPDQPQPSQRAFETQLHQAIGALDPASPVFVEAESRRIGRLDLPATLVNTMHQGRCVRLDVELSQRINFLLDDYAHLFDQVDRFKQKLDLLIGLHSRETINAWRLLADQNQRAELFTALVCEHYDPAYRRSSHSHFIHLPAALRFHFDPTDRHSLAQAHALLTQLEESA